MRAVMRARLIAVFAIGSRRYAFLLLKNKRQIVPRRKPAAIRDLFNGLFRSGKQLFHFGQAQAQQVVHGGTTEVLFKMIIERLFGGVNAFRQIIQREGLGIIRIHIVNGFYHKGRSLLFALHRLRQAALCKMIKGEQEVIKLCFIHLARVLFQGTVKGQMQNVQQFFGLLACQRYEGKRKAGKHLFLKVIQHTFGHVNVHALKSTALGFVHGKRRHDEHGGSLNGIEGVFNEKAAFSFIKEIHLVMGVRVQLPHRELGQ